MIKIKLPKWLPHDKALHIVAGLMAFSIGLILCCVEVGVLVAIAAGFLKEVNDTYWIIPKLRTSKKREFSFSDFVLTFAIPFIIWLFTELT